MKTNRLFGSERFTIISALIISMFILSTTTLKAQNPINFSGKWLFDKAKSSPGTDQAKYDGTVIRQITQNSSTIAYRDIYTQKGSNNWETSDEVFKLDGKEEIIKRDSTSTDKKSTIWSKDNKSLALQYKSIYIEDGVTKELLFCETYELSDDGKTLTIETYSKDVVRGEIKTKSVYHKK